MAKNNLQVKSKERKKTYGEVYTNEREVKAMCDLIPSEIWENIESTFLEPACGTGNFLAEIYSRKLERCKNEKDGLKSMGSIYGVDIQADNVAESRLRLVEMFVDKFPEANDFARITALAIATNNIICDDFLNPRTETLKSWNITADEKYVKAIKKIKKREVKECKEIKSMTTKN